MKLTELFSLEELELELQDGYVKETKHPTLPLTILNYTDKTTYEHRWNPVTTHCRGLIVNNVTHEVIARGPRKFFNVGEPSGFDWPLDTPVRVTRKEDGSLGIGWYYVDEDEDCHYGYATRGSFSSEQAKWANAHFMANKGHDARYEILPDVLMDYAEGNVLSDDLRSFTGRPSSDIVEIVYPQNRIVLDYGDREELIPLGMVDNATGLIVWRPMGVREKEMTLAEALALPIPDDEEGYVLDILDANSKVVIDHLKLKGDKYKELHSAIFGLTERKVYDAWLSDMESDLIEGLPDELQPWALGVAQRFDKEWDELMAEIRVAQSWIPTYGSRKEQAQYIMENHKEISAALFALLDSNVEKCHAWIDKQIKPGHVPFKIIKENAVV